MVERIYHPWPEWECFRAGFFTPTGCRETLERWRSGCAELLGDLDRFRAAMARVLDEWPRSVEHNLTNESMNRIAWLGQASCCIELGACAEQTRSAFNLLPLKKQEAANRAAAEVLDEWLRLVRLFGAIKAA